MSCGFLVFVHFTRLSCHIMSCHVITHHVMYRIPTRSSSHHRRVPSGTRRITVNANKHQPSIGKYGPTYAILPRSFHRAMEVQRPNSRESAGLTYTPSTFRVMQGASPVVSKHRLMARKGKRTGGLAGGNMSGKRTADTNGGAANAYLLAALCR